MKAILQCWVALLLALFARTILDKYHPKIVMVTGSVGKTSTKDAVAAVLGNSFHIRASEKSYNGDIGMPLTIIGAGNPWGSLRGWLQVFGHAFALIFLPSYYPKLLVLEVGADRPGDLKRILRIATPDVVVVTRLPEVPVHVEAYANPSDVREEEFLPAYALVAGAPLILSADDEYAVALAAPLGVTVTTFGVHENAMVRLTNINVYEENGLPAGMQATVVLEGARHTLTVPGFLGRTQLFAPAAALAVAHAMRVDPATALAALANYHAPAGRARILHGKKGSVLVDDTYNASPAAVEEALGALSMLAGRTRIGVLADMLELGRYSVHEHERIGRVAAKHLDMLITVGARSRATAQAALAAGMKESQVVSYNTAQDAIEPLLEMLGTRDVVLVKGSQSMRMERVVEALLDNESDLKFLVRQDAEWKKR